MKTLLDKFFAFLQKYPTLAHLFLVLWNAFFTSWATKISVPLDSLGIPLTMNATAIVDWMQLHMHMPTVAVGIITFIVNCTVAYTTWKKKPVEPIVPKTVIPSVKTVVVKKK